MMLRRTYIVSTMQEEIAWIKGRYRDENRVFPNNFMSKGTILISLLVSCFSNPDYLLYYSLTNLMELFIV
jgi:hypothetical protein